MPLLSNAKKALRVAKRKTVVNSRIRSRVKTSLDSAKKSATAQTLSTAFSNLDKAVKGKLLHKNKVARLKSQLSKLVSGGAPTAKTEKKAAPAAKKPAKKAPAKSASKSAAK